MAGHFRVSVRWPSCAPTLVPPGSGRVSRPASLRPARRRFCPAARPSSRPSSRPSWPSVFVPFPPGPGLVVAEACPLRDQRQQARRGPSGLVDPGLPLADRLLPGAQLIRKLLLREAHVPAQGAHPPRVPRLVAGPPARAPSRWSPWRPPHASGAGAPCGLAGPRACSARTPLAPLNPPPPPVLPAPTAAPPRPSGACAPAPSCSPPESTLVWYPVLVSLCPASVTLSGASR